MAIRSFLRFEVCRIRKGISWFEAKMNIVRNAVNQYIRNPVHIFILKITSTFKVACKAGNRVSPTFIENTNTL